jgi:hypothetical protein
MAPLRQAARAAARRPLPEYRPTARSGTGAGSCAALSAQGVRRRAAALADALGLGEAQFATQAQATGPAQQILRDQ